MISDRGIARIVGTLFIVASATAIVGGSLIAPVEDATSFSQLADDKAAVITGVLFEVLLVLSVIGIAVMIAPVLRRRDEGLALGYVAARGLEAVVLLASATAAAVAVTLADDPTRATAGDGVLGLLVDTREWTYRLGSLALLGVGGLILYTLLWLGRLVPVWLSVWGLVGAALVLVRGVVELYGVDLSGAVQAVLAAPIALNEVVLAVWLIAKGFAAPAGARPPGPAERR